MGPRGGGPGQQGMIAKSELSAEALGNFLATEMNRRCGSSHPRLTELVPFAAQLALECIANSDALYHNVEHTMLVTLAGHDIFVGRALMIPSTPNDYAHLIIACLMHDIGYVRGILRGDSVDGYVVDTTGRKVSLPRGSSDAALMPYHVDRSKMFVHDRMRELDAERIAHAIEFTRFPATPVASQNEANEEGLLVRAADLIGQLGDPHYLRKSNALFCEFDEIGMNKQLGYESPADIVDKYPQFYWNMVSPHIQPAIRYLNVTASGRQWIANLYSNVFRAEREVRLSGPQP
jgi:hypothetical protein